MRPRPRPLSSGEVLAIEIPSSNVSPLGAVLPLEAPSSPDSTVRHRTVFVVDARPVIREGLHRIFARSGTIRVVGEAAGIDDAAPRLRAARPQVVVVSDELAEAMCAHLRVEHPDVGVLVLAAAEREAALFSAIGAGATGVVAKASPVEMIVDAVETVARGGAVLDPLLVPQVFDRLRDPAADEHDVLRLLTDTEQTVLGHLAAGRSNREIAAEVCLSESTVKRHVTSLLRKLGVQSRTEAAVVALRAGIEPR